MTQDATGPTYQDLLIYCAKLLEERGDRRALVFQALAIIEAAGDTDEFSQILAVLARGFSEFDRERKITKVPPDAD